MYRCLVILFVSIALFACKNEYEKMELIEVGRLDNVLSEYANYNEQARKEFVDSMGEVLEMLFAIQNKEVNDSVLQKYSKSHAVTVFTRDINERYNSIEEVNKAISKLEFNISNKLNDKCVRKYYSIVSPYNQSLFMSDSIVFIGLNHYLGNDYEGYKYFEPYQRVVKTQKHLPYDIAEAYINYNYPYFSTQDETVLNVLLYNGAIVYVLMQLVPEADLAEALGYDEIQMDWAQTNEKEAWNALISRNLIYSNDKLIGERLVKPSPVTTVLHQESPGRMGRYIGYKIVESYAKKHKNVDLKWLLSVEFYGTIQSLIEAGYSPN